jgi:hypothetical protein
LLIVAFWASVAGVIGVISPRFSDSHGIWFIVGSAGVIMFALSLKGFLEE